MLNDLQRARIDVDEANMSIVICRHLGAPPDRVYNAWLVPDDLRLWWDPRGLPLAECKIDAREGGEFMFMNAGQTIGFSGTYRTLRAPDLIEFDAMGAQGRLDLGKSGTGTQLVLSIRCPSHDMLRQFLQMGIDDGTRQTVDNLATRFET
jgi:uncharacterized protein YndB with AHSA1/START domain